MVCLIDTNVLLDCLEDRMPFADDACDVWKLCESRQVTGYISALSFANVVYIMRKWLDTERIEQLFLELSGIFRIADLSAEDIGKASSLHWKDYEDAIQAVTAERLHCDAIITRNAKDYAGSRVPAVTPDAFLRSPEA